LGVKSVRQLVIAGIARLIKTAERGDRSAAYAAMKNHVDKAEIEALILARHRGSAAGRAPGDASSKAA
jgi:hypothetical protein